MAASVVYEGVPNTHGETGTLFRGQKFWFSATVPQRQWFIENVKANGGQVVQLEKQADVLLFDHKHKNPAPGTHSYKYVELSIRKGSLERLADHVIAGTSRADRPVGSVTMTSKGSRNPYTEADDQFLWNWVKPLEEAGGAISGNSIYQDLEAVNPRHPYQSWRDRWLKYVRHQTRKITTQVHEQGHLHSTPQRQRLQPGADDGVEGSLVRSRDLADTVGPTQPEHRPRRKLIEVVIPQRDERPNPNSLSLAVASRGKARSRRNAEYEKSGKPMFTADDYDDLFSAAPDILTTAADCLSEAWRNTAKSRAREKEEEAKTKGKTVSETPRRLAGEWREYFEAVIGPDYEEQLGEETGMQGEDHLLEDQPAQVRAITKEALAQSRNTALSGSPTHKSNRRASQSFQAESPILSTSRPESPTPSFSTTYDRVPGPNEARKRSAGKGTNSQESTNSAAKSVDDVEELSQRSTQSQKRKWSVATDDEDEDSLSLPPVGNQEQAKQRMKSKEEPRSLEIPSTPEAANIKRLNGFLEEQGSSQEAGSPTPRPRRSAYGRNGREDIPSSPLFVPQDETSSSRTWSQESDQDRSSPPIDAGVDEILPSTPRSRENNGHHTLTSPLSVRLVSDHEAPAGSSFSQARSEREPDDGSPTPEFETAPNFSQVWETAQENAEAARPHVPRLRDGTIAETQPEGDFALPEPEGGWDDLPLPPEADEQEAVAAEEDLSEDEDDATSEVESFEGWIAAHLEVDPDADDELLTRAAGIADLDFKLAERVYRLLMLGIPVPENVKGIWTERDDMALRGNDADEIRRIEDKHGKESLAGRWQWLENEHR